MNEINGYLEYNGLICKIQSVEQLRDFMNGLGERAKEMTEQELASLCVNPNPGKYVDKEYSDSCGVRYYYDGTKLIQGRADLKEYKIAEFPPDWNKYGKRAGYIRNAEMARYASEENGALIAFWDTKSKGTKHMIDLAKEKNLAVRIVKY